MFSVKCCIIVLPDAHRNTLIVIHSQLNWWLITEWLAVCTKKRIAICYTLVYHSPICYDLGHTVRNGELVTGLFFVEPVVKVSGAKVTFYQTHFVRFYLMAHCTCTLGMRYNSAAAMMLCKLPTSLLISCCGPNSPHLSPLITRFADMYSIMNVRRWSMNVNEFKQCLVEVWSSLQQNIVNTAICEWRKCLQACVPAEEDTLNICYRQLDNWRKLPV